jgi:ABC-type sugar transport system ATPase subunit
MFFLKIRGLTVKESNLEKTWNFKRDSKEVLSGVQFNVEKGEIFGVVGPNGSGKTTLLKTIAGLVRPSEGEIIANGENIVHKKIFERNAAFVFQDFDLYPHFSGRKNIAFPIQMHREKEIKKVSHLRRETDKRVSEIAALLHLDSAKILDRKPQFVSIGERQRIAIGKAIAVTPEVLLLDEPLSNVEDNLRNEIRHNLKNFIRKNGITAIYVSHNQLEIGEIADNVAVLQNGEIEQIGAYQELYENPQTLFVSLFIGERLTNFLPAKEVNRLTNGKINYMLTIRPGECALALEENSIVLKGKVSFIENLIQEDKKIVFIEYSNELFGVELPLEYEIRKNQEISIFVPLKKAKFFDGADSASPKRIYNLW